MDITSVLDRQLIELGMVSRGHHNPTFMQLERPTLRPLSHLPRQEINGAADFDAGQNYTRPAPGYNGVWPWPAMIGMIQGFMPQMTNFVWNNVDIKPPNSFYLGGNVIQVQGGDSFGYGINGLKKIKG